MTGGGRPFGYANDRLTVIDDEADAIRDAAHRMLGGESLVSIVAEWNRTGTPATVHGGLWTQRTLRGILRPPRIAGLSEHKGKVVGTAVWPAIIDRDAWGTHPRRDLRPRARQARAPAAVRAAALCLRVEDVPDRAGRAVPVCPGAGHRRLRVARKYQPLEE